MLATSYCPPWQPFPNTHFQYNVAAAQDVTGYPGGQHLEVTGGAFEVPGGLKYLDVDQMRVWDGKSELTLFNGLINL